MQRQSVVLVAEDDPAVRMYAEEVLSAHGYLTLSASSADEALGILHNRADIDTLLTDVVMPGTLDGLGLVSEVRRRWPRIRIIVSSGRMPAAAIGNADQTRLLAKPFDEAALLAAVNFSQFSRA